MSQVDCHCHIEFDEAISQSRLFFFSLLVSRFLVIGISLTYRLFSPFKVALAAQFLYHRPSLLSPSNQIYSSLCFL